MPKNVLSLARIRAIMQGPLSKLPIYPGTVVSPVDLRTTALRKYRKDHPNDSLLTSALVDMLNQGACSKPEDVRNTPLEGIEFSLVRDCEVRAALCRKILAKKPKHIVALEDLIECLEEGAVLIASDLRDTQFEGYGLEKLKEEPLQQQNLIAALKTKVEDLKRPKRQAKPITVQYDNRVPKKADSFLISDCTPALSHLKPHK